MSSRPSGTTRCSTRAQRPEMPPRPPRPVAGRWSEVEDRAGSRPREGQGSDEGPAPTALQERTGAIPGVSANRNAGLRATAAPITLFHGQRHDPGGRSSYLRAPQSGAGNESRGGVADGFVRWAPSQKEKSARLTTASGSGLRQRRPEQWPPGPSSTGRARRSSAASSSALAASTRSACPISMRRSRLRLPRSRLGLRELLRPPRPEDGSVRA